MSEWAGFSLKVMENRTIIDINGFVDFLRNLTFQLQLPGLNRYGIEEKDIEKICRVTELKNNPAKLSQR